MANENRIIIRNARLSFAHVWEPDENADDRYTTAILFEKNNPAVAKINEIVERLVAEGKQPGGKLAKVSKKALLLPLHDGDDTERPEYVGMYYLNAKRNSRPGIIDLMKNPITDEEEIYSGVYVNISVEFYIYNNQSAGVGCALGNIQKVKDGQRFSGGPSAEEEFDVEEPEDDDDLGL